MENSEDSDYIEEWLKERGISEVEGIVPDMAGVARGKFVPANKFRREGLKLPESVLIQTVTGECSDTDQVDEVDRDMILRPDASTIRMVPWASERTALVIHDCFTQDGDPIDISPRYVLRRVLDLYKAEGWQPVLAPEVEFFLVKPNTDPDIPLEPPVGRSGRQETVRQAFSIDAINEFDPLIDDIYDFCEAQDIVVDNLVHEAGAAQLEINFLHGDPLDLADQVFLFKRLVREAAMRRNIYATFMAKPMENEPGSAMHMHVSVVDEKTGKNIFTDAKGEDSQAFLSYIAGLQRYIPEATMLFAPYVNSYRRFMGRLSSPINVQWGYDNRTVGLRVPRSDTEARRVENRVPGADANPYLAFAATLAAGYLGMKQKMSPGKQIVGSAYELPHSLPREVSQAVGMLRASDGMRQMLGDRFINVYCEMKEEEYTEFFRVISAWEREYLLLNV
ncbi:MAG: glutamine synthetase family protein [Gammaproteobacteria bacterium]|nr:glutamine synthetase family protein [Gammaproteobacteria bacterium]